MRLEDMREQFPKMPESMKQMIEQEVAVQIGQEKENSALAYEVEYILQQQTQDRENLKKTLQEILLLREAVNAAFLFGSSLKAEAETAAGVIAILLGLPEIKDLAATVILFAWAYAESVKDVRILLRGDKIPLVKSEGSWNTPFSQLLTYRSHLDSYRSSADGMSYQDYIKTYGSSEEEKIIMKKKIATILTAAVIGATAFTTIVSAASGDITVVSREDGSGTRGAFVELFGIEEEKDGEKVDMTTDEASVTNSTSVMMTTVAGDENAIGYISLGSLDDTVKAVKIDGVEATVDNVSNDSYKIARPFNILTSDKESDAAKDFVNYIMSSDGQKIVEDNGYIKEAADAKAYEAADGVSGKVVVAGSSSVTPVMEKLAEGYEAVNKDVTVEVQQSDSTTGVNMAAEGTVDIGMASRDLKDEEKDLGLTATVIARDGIAVIVNKDNDVDELTSDQVKAVYTGETTTWEDLAK